MATSPQGFIAAAPPSQVVNVSFTTLFNLAEIYLGNALLWTLIAEANPSQNGDPWVFGNASINIPTNINPVLTLNPTGILTP